MDADLAKTTPANIDKQKLTFEQRFVDRNAGKANSKDPLEERFWTGVDSIANTVICKINKSGTVTKLDLANAITSGALRGDSAQVAAAIYLYFDEVDEINQAIWTSKKISSKDLSSFIDKLKNAEKSVNRLDSLIEWAQDKERWKGITGNSKAKLTLPDIIKAQRLANLSAEDRAKLAEMNANFNSLSKDGKISIHELFEKYRDDWASPQFRRALTFMDLMYDVESNQQSKEAQKLFANEKEPLKSITADSVKQGYAGDCAVRASLYQLTALRPKEVLGMIKPGEGINYDVTFPGKKPVSVRRPTNEELALYNGAKNPNGFWAALICKAYGQYVFGQANFLKKFRLQGSTPEERAANDGRVDAAIETLTGHKVQQSLVKDLSAEQLQIKLLEGQRNKDLMILGSENSKAPTENGFKKQHAYSVSRVDKINNNVNVTVHDPLGDTKKRPASKTVPLESILKNFNSLSIEIQKKS